MHELLDDRNRRLIDRISRRAMRGLKGRRARLAKPFVDAYFERVPAEDLENRSEENHAGQALAFLAFAENRPARHAAIRVFTPSKRTTGWSSDNTVVEIVNDNMPFLVDSVISAVNARGFSARVVIHPIIPVKRDVKGSIIAIEPGRGDFPRESFIHVELDRQASPREMAELERGLGDVLRDVRVAVKDWMPMRAKLAEVLQDLPVSIPGRSGEDIEEVRNFLRWIDDDHFTFLGYRRYDFTRDDTDDGAIVRDSGLGILHDPNVRVFQTEERHLPQRFRRALAGSALVTISKGTRRSTVHRPVHMDTIGVAILDSQGRARGEHRFVGLFTSHAYSLNPRFIPLLRQKLSRVIAQSGFDVTSHDGKALLHILETYPRDELFQISEDDLIKTALGILRLQERPGTALFVRQDPLERFVSCLVFTPRDRFGTPLRERFEEILAAAMDGSIAAFYTHIGDEPLARVHFIVRTEPGKRREFDPKAVERELAAAARSWPEDLYGVLVEAYGQRAGLELHSRYRRAFPSAYTETFPPTAAVRDIGKAEEAVKSGEPSLDLYRHGDAAEDELRLKIYNLGNPLPLSDVLPMLENMGLKVIQEIPFKVDPAGAAPVWIHDFGMRRWPPADTDDAPDFPALKEAFEEAFVRLWRLEIEDDGFNRLVLAEGLAWREVALIRAYSKYLRQARAPFSQEYMMETFVSNRGFARRLVDLFAAAFDPDDRSKAESRAVTIRVAYEDALDSVRSLDEDRILRRFLNLVVATLRTNYYQCGKGREPKAYISLKLDSGEVEELPLPRPWREIFVYSPAMEGIHLRGGPVARGGIRWSDRREDFRTEVLGLMKAQMVKNPVIVPVGAKGGFVVKRPPAEGGREATVAEGIECYKTLMRGLLDITDNRTGAGVKPPKDVLRHDGDDPYLVVAADKGTATFSDIANGVSRDYEFWLDDAFASGGSVGYDHKKMGITARGAWESVKRHFRELGRDIQREDFTVIGIGDMAGDVFGNGMLLSRHIKLLGAFNHLHIFIDPDPDPAQSFAERRRLFRKPRSTWMDYKKELISKGGGVFERGAKSVRLSTEMQALLDTNQSAMAPDDLIRRLLRVEADLLWFGGIGTFVKASAETDAAVGDRTNDPVRVDARDLRCKVVGEGANLGMTQRGRVEYARAGGRLNTDAVDNSAGVDCSDHEVNIKILLGQAMAAGRLTIERRDRLLADMTKEVAQLVLRDNYLQTDALSVAEAETTERLPNFARLIRALEREGRVNRAVDALPDEEALDQLAHSGLGLTRPESAVLMAHAKLRLNDQLLASDLPDDPLLLKDLVDYFPTPLHDEFADDIATHRLRREIIVTAIANQLVNRAGITFANDLRERTGRDAPAVARAFAIVRDAFGCEAMWARIERLDNKVATPVQTAMKLEVKGLVERTALWFLNNGQHPLDITRNIDRYGPGIDALCESLCDVVAEDDRAALDGRQRKLMENDVPKGLAAAVARLPVMGAALDIVRATGEDGAAVADVARVHFSVGARFGFDWLRAAARRIEAQTPWQRQAVQAMLDELDGLQYALVCNALAAGRGAGGTERAVDLWSGARKGGVKRMEDMLSDMRSSGAPDIAMMAVATRQLRLLVGG